MAPLKVLEGGDMSDRMDIPGVLYGSRLIEQPHVKVEVDAVMAFLRSGAKRYLEIGFDHGYRLKDIAARNPQYQCLGVEVRERRVQALNQSTNAAGLENVLAWRMDARTVVHRVLPSNSIDYVDILFPTPWWDAKKRVKRLLIQPTFLMGLHRILKPHGALRIETDVPEYADRIAESFRTNADHWRTGQTSSHLGPKCDALSRRQRKCQRENIPYDIFVFEAV